MQKMPALVCAGAGVEEAFGHRSVTVPCQQVSTGAWNPQPHILLLV